MPWKMDAKSRQAEDFVVVKLAEFFYAREVKRNMGSAWDVCLMLPSSGDFPNGMEKTFEIKTDFKAEK